MPPDRKPRGRVGPEPRAPNAEPVYLPDPIKKLEFGRHTVCYNCKGKGKKGGNICGVCRGEGITNG